MKGIGHFISAFMASILLVSCARGQSNAVHGSTIIDHVTVLHGRGGPAVPDARVVVRGDRIVSISRSSNLSPKGEHVIDGSGKFLLPGFIDMHAHLLFPRCTSGEGPPRFSWSSQPSNE